MENKRSKIELLLILSKEVDVFYSEIVKYIPTLLSERYKKSEIQHSETILSITKAELPILAKNLQSTCEKYLTEEDVDFLLYLFPISDGVNFSKDLFEAMEQAKDLWFNMLILKIDNVMDHLENGEFVN